MPDDLPMTMPGWRVTASPPVTYVLVLDALDGELAVFRMASANSGGMELVLPRTDWEDRGRPSEFYVTPLTRDEFDAQQSGG
jgi:hypothetical protein